MNKKWLDWYKSASHGMIIVYGILATIGLFSHWWGFATAFVMVIIMTLGAELDATSFYKKNNQ